MGAVLLSARVAAAIQPGDHATTFGGGPFVASVARAVLRRISDPDFLADVRRKGARLEAALRALVGRGGVVEARGRGMMWGLELEGAAAPVIGRALEAGLLVIAAGERVVRLLPPLAIPDADLERGLEILAEVVA